MDWALARSLLSCSHYFKALALGFTQSVVDKTVEDSGLSTQPERFRALEDLFAVEQVANHVIRFV